MYKKLQSKHTPVKIITITFVFNSCLNDNQQKSYFNIPSISTMKAIEVTLNM